VIPSVHRDIHLLEKISKQGPSFQFRFAYKNKIIRHYTEHEYRVQVTLMVATNNK
jgi:hypothetical protein